MFDRSRRPRTESDEGKERTPTEVPDLDALAIGDDGVDGEMCVYKTHFVLESLLVTCSASQSRSLYYHLRCEIDDRI